MLVLLVRVVQDGILMSRVCLRHCEFRRHLAWPRIGLLDDVLLACRYQESEEGL